MIDLLKRFQWPLFVTFQALLRLPFFLRAEERMNADEAFLWLVTENNLRGVHFVLHPYAHSYLGLTDSLLVLPFIPFVGHTGLAQQLGLLVAYCVFAWVTVRITRSTFGDRAGVLSYFFMLLPSSFLVLMSASFLGGHFTGTVIWLAGLYLLLGTFRDRAAMGRLWLRYLAAGFLFGLAHYTTHLSKVSLAATLPLLILSFWTGSASLRARISWIAACLGGIVLGLVPEAFGKVYAIGGLTYRQGLLQLTVQNAVSHFMVFLQSGVPVMSGLFVDKYMQYSGFYLGSDVRPLVYPFTLFLVGLMLVYLPLNRFLALRQQPSDWIRMPNIVVGTFLILFAGNVGAYLLLNVPWSGAWESRYLMPLVAMCPIILAGALAALWDKWARLAKGIVIAYFLIQTAGYVGGYTRKDLYEFEGSPGSKQVYAVLKEKGIRYSLANYLIAFPMVKLSGGTHLSTPDATLGPVLNPHFPQTVIAASHTENIAIVQTTHLIGGDWLQRYWNEQARQIELPGGIFRIIEDKQVHQYRVFIVRWAGPSSAQRPPP